MRFQKLITIPILLLLTQSAFAQKISDITRMGGARINVLTGMGLVVGLKHTGDGGAYQPTMRSLTAMMARYGCSASLAEVNDATNVAIVSVYAKLPVGGVRNGDQVDVQVVSMGAATSLKGGVLCMTALNGPTGQPYPMFDNQGRETKISFALASGTLDADGEPSSLRGVIRGGAVMEVDLIPKYIDDKGRFQLIIDNPASSWASAHAIAKLINESHDSADIAVALDPKTVLVQIPVQERAHPDGFIATILALSMSNSKESVPVAGPVIKAVAQFTEANLPWQDAAIHVDGNGQWMIGVLLLVIGVFCGRKFAAPGAALKLKRGTMSFQRLMPVVFVLLLCQLAFAEKIADITRMDGARTNVITGMGLVMGLKGTGDGGAYLPAMRPLQQMLSKYDNVSSLSDLSAGTAANVAIVSVYATLPTTGVHGGDKVDVQVVSMGAATSLKNGVLFMVAMNGPSGKPFTTFDKLGHEVKLPFALASGNLEPDENPTPLKGVVRSGATMEVDLPPRYIDQTGRFKLNIAQPFASWKMSNTIAKLINESSDTDNVAVALDPATVLVQIPESERNRPDGFIASILALPIPASAAIESTEARVLIDDASNTLTITGDVEISPVVISHKGLTITAVTPTPVPTARNPLVQVKTAIPLDTTNQGGARLKDLAAAFDQLKVPTEDRIAIVKNLYDIGKLHAKMTIDGQER